MSDKISAFIKKIKPIYAILAIILGLTLLSCFGSKKTVSYSYQEEVDLGKIAPKGYEIEGNTFTSINNDPKIYIPPSAKEIDVILIEFSEPITEKTIAQLFYSMDESGRLVADKPFNTDVMPGDDSVALVLPEKAVYTSLRFDMSGTFSIESIQMGCGEVTENVTFDLIRFIIAFVIIAALGILYFKFTEKADRFFAFIYKKLYTTAGFEIGESYKKRLSNLYLILSLCFGTMIVFLNPPQCSPDEPTHFNHVCQVSRFNLFADINEGQTGVWNTYDEVNFERYYHMDKDTVISLSYYSENAGAKGFMPLASISPVGYLVAGFGVAAIRLIFGELSPYTTMLVGKMANLIFASAIIALSIRKSKALNNTIFLLAMMPMSLYMCASLSYDAVVIPCSFLLFSYVTKILRSEDTYRVTIEDIIAVSVSCFFLTGAKSAAYAPLIIILLTIGYKKFGSIKRFLLCAGLEISVCVVSYVIPTCIANRIAEMSNAIYTVTDEIIIQQQQQEYLASHVEIIPKIVIETYSAYGQKYWEGFIGCLGGWQDVRMPYAFLILFSLVLIFSILVETCSLSKLNIGFRICSLVGSLTSFMGITLIMYLSYAPLRTKEVGGLIAYGVQGRYFIPILIFFLIAFANPLIYKFKYTKQIFALETNMVKVAAICSGAMTVFTLLTAYWL